MYEPAFVRTKMLPEQAPSVSRKDNLGWLREKLFFSIGSSIATLLVLAAFGWLVSFLLAWAVAPT